MSPKSQPRIQVLTIAGHVWRNEHPLWQRVRFELVIEHGQRFNFCQPVLLVRHRVVDDGRIMLPDIHLRRYKVSVDSQTR
jgi:hypothetical protein